MTSRFDCAVIGDWHLAFITAASLTRLGHHVALVQPDSAEKKWGAEFPTLDLNEPGLPEAITEARANGRLRHFHGVSTKWSADIVWMAIDTPVNDQDEPDLRPLRQVAQAVAESQKPRCANLVFALNSQVPVGFGGELESRFGFEVAYIPENLRLGKGMETFLEADRTVIGANRPATRETVRKFLGGLKTQFLLCDLVTSEMIKHATNAFLATSISFANQLARIGESVGADNQVVGKALKMDLRIGPKAYVAPGLGFAGGTLPRDLRVLQEIGRKNRIATPLVDAVFEINETTTRAIGRTLDDALGGLRGRRILLLGYSYKADTDTFRRSPSVALAQELRAAGASPLGFDPMMNARDLAPIQGLIEHHPDWGSACRSEPDAVVVMTARPEFKNLDWVNLGRSARKPAIVFDTLSALTAGTVLESGIPYKALWQPIRRPENQ